MTVQKVGQTMTKDFLRYEAGDGCGLQFEAKHIKENYPDDASKAAKKGQYFEYLLLGTVPKQMKKIGKRPEPEYMLTPLKDLKAGKISELKVEHMTADYREIHRKVELVKEYLKAAKIEITRKNVEISNDWGRGTVDFYARSKEFFGTDEEVIVDLKYTRLRSDKWSEYGFLFETKEQRDHHGVQAKQYHLIDGKRFFFMLVASGEVDGEPDDVVEFVEMTFDDEGLMSHRSTAQYVLGKINMQEQIGFVARPTLERCGSCMIAQACKHRTIIPSIRSVKV